jgi:hypothetical protein
MKDLTDAIDDYVHRVGEMTLTELNDAVQILERGLIHVMLEQHLRVHEGVSHLRAVSDTSD